MIAKATAREAGCNFINLDISSLTDKWYGESQKLACAVFTLAIKIQPCIIFIDEIGKCIGMVQYSKLFLKCSFQFSDISIIHCNDLFK